MQVGTIKKQAVIKQYAEHDLIEVTHQETSLFYSHKKGAWVTKPAGTWKSYHLIETATSKQLPVAAARSRKEAKEHTECWLYSRAITQAIGWGPSQES